MKSAVGAILSEFPDADSYHVSYMASIDISDKWRAGRGIPLSSRVMTTDSTASILGKSGADKMTWAELTERYRPPGKPNAPWLKELNEAFNNAVLRRSCAAPQETFESHDGVMILRPMLHSINRIGAHPMRAEIVFVVEVAPAEIGGPAFAMLRALERNNSEIIEPFLQFATDTPLLTNNATPKAILERLELIKKDISHRRVFDKDRLAMFEQDQASAEALRKTWDTCCARLQKSCSAQSPNLARIASRLSEMRETNNALTKLASQKYSSFVDRRT